MHHLAVGLAMYNTHSEVPVVIHLETRTQLNVNGLKIKIWYIMNVNMLVSCMVYIMYWK